MAHLSPVKCSRNDAVTSKAGSEKMGSVSMLCSQLPQIQQLTATLIMIAHSLWVKSPGTA